MNKEIDYIFPKNNWRFFNLVFSEREPQINIKCLRRVAAMDWDHSLSLSLHQIHYNCIHSSSDPFDAVLCWWTESREQPKTISEVYFPLPELDCSLEIPLLSLPSCSSPLSSWMRRNIFRTSDFHFQTEILSLSSCHRLSSVRWRVAFACAAAVAFLTRIACDTTDSAEHELRCFPHLLSTSYLVYCSAFGRCRRCLFVASTVATLGLDDISKYAPFASNCFGTFCRSTDSNSSAAFVESADSVLARYQHWHRDDVSPFDWRAFRVAWSQSCNCCTCKWIADIRTVRRAEWTLTTSYRRWRFPRRLMSKVRPFQWRFDFVVWPFWSMQTMTSHELAECVRVICLQLK